MAMVDIGGTRLAVSLELLDENVVCGDYVISHAGFAIHKVNEATAQENLAFLKELHTHEIY
jgi:hydrogenase expression/formation protein HypC